MGGEREALANARLLCFASVVRQMGREEVGALVCVIIQIQNDNNSNKSLQCIFVTFASVLDGHSS